MEKKLTVMCYMLLFTGQLLAQEIQLTKDTKLQSEREIALKILTNLRQSTYDKCYEFIFAVRFELDKKTGIVKNLKFSENIVDTAIINIVRKAIIDTQSIWNLKNCKKANPSLRFLQPIYLFMNRNGCINTLNTSDVFHPDYIRKSIDFTSLIQFPINEYAIDSAVYNDRRKYLYTKEKFVGMVLSPILTGIGRSNQ